ncbi:phospholipase A [Aestuariibacter halophilus]|uniref:Phospholipase A1 n=1 Tax=Fluctibacter halophilus TaxID=226011 RepID=A0ABS8GA42_9ALTE|nr:phospholipase A [Aestuariibacter halophilus]MCC2617412.1 phospholipase A [Aestuariibacter halophilus]
MVSFRTYLIAGLLMALYHPFDSCANTAQQAPVEEVTEQTSEEPAAPILEERMKADRDALKNPFAITQHRPNYLLPYSHVSNPNPLGNNEDSQNSIDNNEAKFQISMRMPIYQQDDRLDGVYFGFTVKSFWQLYNSDASKPFRETNYEPEVFYEWHSDIRFLGYDFNIARLGINHQSNGQSGIRSRSWNRIYASLLFSDQDEFYFLKAWYRIKEEEKLDPNDVTGDDNPDITHYLGHLELGYGTRFGKWQLMTMLRNNLKSSDNKGSIELNLTYPVTERYSVLLQYFNGYGDSLIDYNRHQQRIGIGVQLTFL